MHGGNLVLLNADNAEWVLESMLGALSNVEQGFEKAAARAINKTLGNGARITARMVTSEFAVKQSEVLDKLSMRKATYSRVEGELNATGRGSLPLIRYAVGSAEPVPTMPKYYRTPKAERVKGVKVKVKKSSGVTMLQSAFLAEMDSGHVGVFERKDKDDMHSPITEMYGTSYLTYLQEDLVADELEEKVFERFEHHLEHEATFVLRKAGLR
ncbi:phage tail protein [Pseudodesulfovibrio thermohalotolerans]|uniref:phage tail protein n=1 Tax=Pseudodesulfovibrio thermohalotolerans TaxID=2880651 RepID=UPI002442A012|nr:phage tail protein [Pseudodesulfovibrio thermohalotolerans]WFS63454.1 phage tail protein [Pseudodesulfovibrio thermohalotolerans]